MGRVGDHLRLAVVDLFLQVRELLLLGPLLLQGLEILAQSIECGNTPGLELDVGLEVGLEEQHVLGDPPLALQRGLAGRIELELLRVGFGRLAVAIAEVGQVAAVIG